MAARSILDIDVNTGAFDAFQARFHAYQEALKKLPGAWGAADKAVATTGDRFTEMTAALMAQNELLAKQTAQQSGLQRATATTDRSMHSLARNTASVARHIGSATVSLLKWASLTSVFSGLLGAGGLFGIERLAMSAGGALRGARGLGVTSGEQQAFGINYGRFVDPNSVLSNVAAAKNDYSQRWAFSAMGVNPSDVDRKDPAQLAADMAVRAKRIFDQSDQSQQQAQARGLLQFFSMDELRRLHNTPAAELDAARAGYERDSRTLAVDPQTQKAWQDFSAQMARAGQEIENVFIKGLSPLAPELAKLSDAFTKAVADLLSSPQLKEWIGDLADGIKWLAGYLRSDGFREDVTSFVHGVEDMAHAVGAAVRWILSLLPDSAKKAEAATPGTDLNRQEHAPGEPGWGYTPGLGWHRTPLQPIAGTGPLAPGTQTNEARGGLTLSGRQPPVNNPGNLRVPGSATGFQQFPTSEAGLRAMRDQLLLYEDRDHLHTIRQIVSKWAPSSENDTDAYIRDVARRTQLLPDQQLDLHDNSTMATLMSAMTKHENSASNYPPNVIITVLNNTGGSAVVTTSQVAR